MRNLILVPVLILLGSSETQAQRRSDRAAMAFIDRPEAAIRLETIRQPAGEGERRNLTPGGLAGALAFGAIGAFVGFGFADDSCDYFCGVTEALVGSLIGEAVGVPIGVRMAGGHGSIPTQILLSTGVAAMAAWAVPMTFGLSLLAMVPVQLHLVIRDAKGDTTRTEAPR